MKDYLRKKATARTGPGEIIGVGRVIGYCDAPTVCIELDDGAQMNWRADLCTFEDWTDADEVKVLKAEVERLTRELSLRNQQVTNE